MIADRLAAARGGRLQVWLAWTAAVLTFVVLGAASGFGAATPVSALPAALRNVADGWYFRLTPVYAQVFAVVGALIVWRRPGNRVGWVACAIGLLVAVEEFVGSYADLAAYGPHRGLPAAAVAEWLSGWEWLVPLLLMVVVLPFLFPDGRPPRPGWGPLLCIPLVSVIAVAVGTSIGAGALNLVGQFIDVTCIPLTVVSVVVRYRRAPYDQRQQIRWFLAAVLLVAVVGVAGTIVSFAVYHNNTVVFNPYFDVLIPLALTAIPVSIGVAVLRYHLYDIDTFLRRAIVYGALLAIIAVLYVIVVVSIGTRISPNTPTDRAIPFVVAAVLAIALQPVRSRLQRVANRLVYGRRMSPYEVLAEFSRATVDRYAGEDLPQRMARMLAGATDADRAEVWLHVGNELRRAAAWPDSGGAAAPVAVDGASLAIPGAAETAPVAFEADLLGALALVKREPLTQLESRLLRDLAHEAGIVLKNSRLTAELTDRLDELTASRQRLVAAQDSERRRLERNLHDGAQQLLVALKINLGVAKAVAVKDPERTAAMLDELSSQATEALETLRELARGIYPPILADSGLAAALEAHVRRVAVPVTVDAGGLRRHPQDVEAAVYFCCLEALQNIVKHAHATKACVTVRDDADHIVFTVSDDGVGIDPQRARSGSGMQNMRDRLAALGGVVDARGGDGGGTTISGSIPLPARIAQDVAAEPQLQVTSP